MSRLYQIHEFAELAGVTVRALHHYDRLGLLKPSRTNPTRTGAGYRRYSAQDLEKLEQIVALKFLGFPLKQIRAILERSTPELATALRLQRRALEDRQMLLGRAIRAIGAAETSTQSGQTVAATDPALLKKVIEVLHMQDGIEGMKKYYSTEEAWEKRRRYYEEGPSPEWQALYRDVSAALDVDPGSDTAQALAERWLELSLRAAQGDPEVQLDSPTAWMDREHWPAPMKRRIAEFNLEAVSEFIARVAAASRKKYFSARAWALLVQHQRDRAELDLSSSWQAHVDLFAAIEAALTEDPAAAKPQTLADRWRAQIELYSLGDAEVKAGVMTMWADRRNWPATLRHQMQGLHMMSYERILECAAFLDRAIGRAGLPAG
jgi:DNA-binding transcriptional MerR regulator